MGHRRRMSIGLGSWCAARTNRPIGRILLRICRIFLARAENSARHPQRGHEYVRRVSEKGRLISFDQMAQPCQCEASRNQQQSDDPVKPNHDQRRKADWNGNHVKRPVHRMVMRAVVMRIETHGAPHVPKLATGADYTSDLPP